MQSGASEDVNLRWLRPELYADLQHVAKMGKTGVWQLRVNGSVYSWSAVIVFREESVLAWGMSGRNLDGSG